MVTIINKPKTKKVKLFKCPCGCEFTAEIGDYTLCLSVDEQFSYYTIACPFCNYTHIYPYEEVKDIMVNV